MKLRTITATFCIALAILMLLCFACYWVMETPPVSQKDAKAIVNGMGQTEVLSLLGEPYQVLSTTSGKEWIYGNEWKWIKFTVCFSNDGKVVDSYYGR